MDNTIDVKDDDGVGTVAENTDSGRTSVYTAGEEPIFRTPEKILAPAMLLCGFLYCNILNTSWFNAGITLLALILFGVSFAYLTASGYRQNAAGVACLAAAGLSAAQFALFDNGALKTLNFIFITAVYIYWVSVTTGSRLGGKLSIYIIGDAVNHGLCLPMQNFGRCASGIKSLFKNKTGKQVIPAIIGFLLFFPLIALVVHLLASADEAFGVFIFNISYFLDELKFINYFMQFVFGIPVAFYLYGLLYGNARRTYRGGFTELSVDKAAAFMRFAPKAAIYCALTSFNVIYLIFYCVQAVYLFSAFRRELPDAYTYAEYARRGFFEFCVIAAINLFILTIFHLFIKRERGEAPRFLKAGTLAICGFTIILIITALSKMAMYIDVYGYTQLRVFTSWFMAMLLFVFIIICARQLRKFNAARIIIAGCAALFMALSYSNADGLIAKSNIERYEAGTLKELDINMLGNLSDAAVPHLYDLFLRTDESDIQVKNQLTRAIMIGGERGTSGERWLRGSDEWTGRLTDRVTDRVKLYNYQRQRADDIRDMIWY